MSRGSRPELYDYAPAGLAGQSLRRIDEALRRAGFGDRIIGWADLKPLDQFHVRGLDSSKELAESLDIVPGFQCSMSAATSAARRVSSPRPMDAG